MIDYDINYGRILLFLLFGGLLSTILVVLPLIIAKYHPYKDKLSPYECGIIPLSDAKQPFDIRFYLIAILFIIFDLEVVLLFPWALNLKNYSLLGFVTAMSFLGIVTLGLIYEWKSGALDW